MSRELDIKTKNVNSKPLYNDINEFVESGLMVTGISWLFPGNKQSFYEVMDEWLQEFVEDGKITQYDVICDDRNNTPDDEANGIFNVTLKYKQAHCLNTTEIHYKLSGLSTSDLPEFTITF